MWYKRCVTLLNLRDYTTWQLVFYATGAYLCVVAYIIYIRNGFKYGIVEMPAFAACGNIGWELVWALVFTTDLGALCVYAHKAWFLLDLVIFYLVVKYAHKQTDIPLLRGGPPKLRRWSRCSDGFARRARP